MDKFSELKAAAMAATPGPWGSVYDDWSDGDDALISSESRDGMVAIAKIEGGGPDSGYDEPFSTEQQANTAFIAAANPAVVFELLAERDADKKRIAELEAKLATPVQLQNCDFESVAIMAHWCTDEQLKAWVKGVEHAKKQIRASVNQPVSQGYALPESWISRDERMPKDGDVVLVFEEGGIIFCAEVDNGEFYPDEFPLVPTRGKEITHWMPLPTPPEVRRDDA